ncbi:acid protease [Thozetella sp. PMI_491]|nr:acid protease [Thozetella sp. PMI_491]
MRSPTAWRAALLPSLVSGAVLELPITFVNSYALVELEAGTPPQSHSLFFDTGSGPAWMVSDRCGASSCTNPLNYPKNLYNSSQSSTDVDLGVYSETVYSGGTVDGFAVADQFSSSGLSWNQSFVAANRSTWSNVPGDGFLGLAFQPLAESTGTKTVMQALLDQDLLDEPRFAIYYGKEFNYTIESSTKGVMTIGGSEEDKYVDGDLTWVEPLRLYDTGAPNLQYIGWRANVTGWSGTHPNGTQTSGTVASGSTQASTINAVENGQCIFDTGGGPIILPTDLTIPIYESIGMNYTAIIKDGYRPKCTEFTSDWSVTFYFENSNVTIYGDQLRKPGFPDGKSTVNCWPPFNTGNSAGFFLFGSNFMHNMYSVFDFGGKDDATFNPRMGFGTLKEEYRAY